MKSFKHTIVTITGPTCSGKSHLAGALALRGIPEVRSFTTRKPRPGETDGEEYDFMTAAQVEAIDKSEFIERIVFNGNYYGNLHSQLKQAMEESDGTVTVVVEPAGVFEWAAAARKLGLNHFSMYLAQEKETLVRRFTQERMNVTGAAAVADAKRRMDQMLHVELPHWPALYDYELTVRNLGEGEQYTTLTENFIYGFLSSAFNKR